MITVAYPDPQFRMRQQDGVEQIFDVWRKQWVRLSPEEWVRQNFVQFLVQEMGYPAQIIALEKELVLNGMKRRFDLLVYDAQHQPWMLVECKATTVALGPEVLEQVLRYNISIPVPYLVITNGAATRAWQKNDGQLEEINILPLWQV